MVGTHAYVPERGDVVWLSLNPEAGHEKEGRRPALVVSPAVYNSRSGLALFCPVTAQVKGYPFEVLVPDSLPVQGAILSDQVRSLDWRARQAEPICHFPDATTAEVLAKASTLLSL